MIILNELPPIKRRVQLKTLETEILLISYNRCLGQTQGQAPYTLQRAPSGHEDHVLRVDQDADGPRQGSNERGGVQCDKDCPQNWGLPATHQQVTKIHES